MELGDLATIIPILEGIVAKLKEMNVADGVVILFLLCFFHKGTRQRIFGNGNGNYITKEEMEKHIEEDHKHRDKMFGEIRDAIAKLHERIDNILLPKKDKGEGKGDE